MMNQRFISVGIALTLAMSFARGQGQPAAPIDPDKVNELAKPVLSAGKMVEDQLTAYAKKKGISYGASANGRMFYRATSQVSVDPTNAQWGKARTMAFEQAVSKAQAEFARDQFGKQRVQTERQLFEDASDGADEFPAEAPEKTRARAVYDKLIALKDAKLNKKLEELGIDPEQFSAKSPEQQITLFSQAMVKRTLVRAIGEIAGLTIIQTFEGSDEEGQHTIGVVLCYSPKLRQLAYDISHRRQPKLTGKPKRPVAEHIPTDPEILQDQFGVRVLFDENGSPVLVSYGQWSHNYTGKSSRIRERRRETATRRAIALADSYITEFLAGKIEFLEETTTGEAVEEFLKKDGDGNVSEQEITKVINRINEQVKTNASADLAGRMTFRKWSHRHPNGTPIVGAIRTWTLSNLEATKAIRNWKPESGVKRATEAKPGAKPATGKREVRQGVDTDIDDF